MRKRKLIYLDNKFYNLSFAIRNNYPQNVINWAVKDYIKAIDQHYYQRKADLSDIPNTLKNHYKGG